MYTKTNIDKIEGLEPAMKQLWIDTKVKQIEVAHPTSLKPIDTSAMNVLITDTMLNVESKLQPYSSLSLSLSREEVIPTSYSMSSHVPRRDSRTYTSSISIQGWNMKRQRTTSIISKINTA